MLKGNAPVLFFLVLFLRVAGVVSFVLATAPVDSMLASCLNQSEHALHGKARGYSCSAAVGRSGPSQKGD
jgi:hypothetical protein